MLTFLWGATLSDLAKVIHPSKGGSQVIPTYHISTFLNKAILCDSKEISHPGLNYEVFGTSISKEKGNTNLFLIRTGGYSTPVHM